MKLKEAGVSAGCGPFILQSDRYTARACVSIHIKAPTLLKANTRAGALTSNVIAAAITKGLVAAAAAAKAFIPALAISVPMMTGRAYLLICRRDLSPMGSRESSSATKPEIIAATLQISQLSAAVTI
jgi:hypothetical protein